MFSNSPISITVLSEPNNIGSQGKRIFDLAMALPMFAVALPLIAIASVAVFAEMHASPLFRQKRIGKRMQVFNCYKIRTMRPGTEEVPTHRLPAERITRVGAFLRKTKIDELPQLLNVIKGEMSLVGPRPCLPSQTRLIELRHARGVDALTPGITGIAQSAGIDMRDEERLVETETRYTGPWRLSTDLRVLMATIRSAIRREPPLA